MELVWSEIKQNKIDAANPPRHTTPKVQSYVCTSVAFYP